VVFSSDAYFYSGYASAKYASEEKTTYLHPLQLGSQKVATK